MELEDDKLDELMCDALIKYAKFVKRFKPALERCVTLEFAREYRIYDFGSVDLWNSQYCAFSQLVTEIRGTSEVMYLRDASVEKCTFYLGTERFSNQEVPINLDHIYPTLAKSINSLIHYDSTLILGLMEFNNVSDLVYNEFNDFVYNLWYKKFGPSLILDDELRCV